MAKSTDLFQLIQAMSPSEKRYFRGYANRHVIGQENRYFKLFQAMNRLEVYNEELLLEQFKGEQFVAQFSVAKNYLYHMLLQCLREFHRAKSPGSSMREFQDHFELLFARGLFKQCEKLLRKAEKLAQAQEAYLNLYELRVLQKRLLKRMQPGRATQRLAGLSADETHFLECVRLQSRLRFLHDQVFALVASVGLIRSEEEEASLDQILKAPELQNEASAPGFEGKIIFNYVHAYAARLMGQPLAVLPHYARMLMHWDNYPDRQKSHPDRYIRTLIAYLDTNFQAGQYQVFRTVLDKVRAVPVQAPPLKAQVFYFTHLLELRYHLQLGQLAQARDQVPAIQEGLLQHQPFLGLDLQTVLAFNLASLFFLSNLPRESLQWINRILNESSQVIRKDILRAARMLNLIVHHELGNQDYIDALQQSVGRFLQKEPGDHRFEQTLLRGIKKVDRVNAPERECQLILGQLSEIHAENPNAILGSEEVLHWLQAKTERQSLPEAYTRSRKEKLESKEGKGSKES